MARVYESMEALLRHSRSARLAVAAGILLATLPLARADELRFRSLTVRDGLSQSHVETITQDLDGYIWLGTASGLNRYDGYDVEVYKHDPDDASSLSNDGVYALHVDAQGTVWVGTNAGLSRFVPGTDSFIRWTTGSSGPDKLLVGGVTAITSDRSGMLWIGTGELNRIAPETGTVTRYPIGHGESHNVHAIHEDSSGRLWVGVGGPFEPPALPGDGLFLFDRESESFVRLPLPAREPESAARDNRGVTSIVEDTLGRLWVGTWGGGLFQVTDGRALRVRLRDSDTDHHEFVRRILTGEAGRLWIITSRVASWYSSSGITDLLEYDPAREVTRHIPATDAAHAHTDVFVDRTGTLWLATSGSGAYYGDIISGHMRLYSHRPYDPNSLASSFVRAVFQDEDGTVWVGHPKGLDRIDRVRETIRHFAHDSADTSSLAADRVQAIHRDRTGILWVGTAGGGLSRLRPDGTGFDSIRHDPDDASSLSSDLVTAILEDRDGALWVGTADDGLNLYDTRRNRSVRYLQDLDDSWNSVVALFEDSAGRLWIGTRLGLARLDPERNSVLRYGIDIDSPDSLMGVAINAIAEIPGEPGVLWLATGGRGLVRFDAVRNVTERHDREEAELPDNAVNGVLADHHQGLWISTQRGFGRFDSSTGECTSFGLDRGLQSLEFNRNAFHRGPDGEMFFGGVDGLNSFFPEDLHDNPHPPQIVLTRVRAFDRTANGDEAGGETILRHGGLPDTTAFPYSQRDVSFNFTALHFTNAGQNRYAYRLDGYDSAWRDADVLRQADYTNLEHGTYTFRVKAANAHGVWSTDEAFFTFTIKRPFWVTWWFYLLVGATVVGLSVAGFRWRTHADRRRQEILEREIAIRTGELQAALATVEEQTKQLRELDEAKSRFVANISHELRTPLTLLAGPLEDLRDGAFGPVSEQALQELDVSVRNGRRLQRLVEQLLSVSKLEAGELRLRVQQGDLVNFLGALALAFSPLAERRQIEFYTDLPDHPILLWYDGQKLEEVFTNLLSNAFKFTPEGGTVLLRVLRDPSDDTVEVQFKDNGPGIPTQHLDQVFERFYRVEEAGFVARPGTGIGLSLVRELVQLHGGSVFVESEVGLGSSFVVKLRSGEAHFAEDQIDRATPYAGGPGAGVVSAIDDLAEPLQPENTDDGTAGDLPTILVVDDNQDIRRLLRRHLVEDYRILEAENGSEGLARARESMPDVIISDVLMPEMDGKSMCRAIKADPALEFIPVVLLTAKAQARDKVTGLECGADDYVTKPFDARELRARVANLIKLRHRLKIRIEEQGNVSAFHTVPPDIDRADTRFLIRVREAVERGLSDEEFGVEELAATLRMSRVHLYRRLREICGQAPGELLMETRLERAAQLLAASAGTVSEVAYGVGFKSLSHFTRRFRKKHGESPSAYRARHADTGA